MSDKILFENKNLTIADSGVSLTISKTKSKRQGEILLLLLMPLMLGVAIFYFVWIEKVNIKGRGNISAVIVFFTYGAISFINILIKTLVNIREKIISINEGKVFLNNKFLSSINDLEFIIVQPSFGTFGLGKSSSLGLSSKSGSTPITYFHGDTEVRMIADILSTYLKKEVVYRKPLLFSFFTKW